jgi:hypothetical protein
MADVINDEAFGERTFGVFHLVHTCSFIAVHWRVLPLSGLVIVLGFLIGELMRYKIEEADLASSMPTLLTVTIFFCQSCIQQAFVDSNAAYTNFCATLTSIVAATNCQKSKTIANLVLRACTGIIYTSSISKHTKSYRDDLPAVMRHLEDLASDKSGIGVDAGDSASVNRDSIVSIVSMLHSLSCQSKNSTLRWGRRAMMDIILLTLSVIMPVCLLSVIGRAYIIVYSIVVIVIMGIYDMALAGTDPTCQRFSRSIRRYIDIVSMIRA